MTDERDCPDCRDYLALGERCVHENDATRAAREAVEAVAMVPLLRERVAELKAERDALRARVAELEAFEAAAKERVAGLVTTNAELSAWVTDLQGDARHLTAECERFKAQRDEAAARAGQRLAERDAALATLERVRLTAGAWRDFASGIAEKAWTRESTEHREGYGEALADCAEEIEAALASPR